MPAHPVSTPERPFHLGTKPDAERCLARLEAWFHQAILDRVPVRFQHHNAQNRTIEGEQGDHQEHGKDEALSMGRNYGVCGPAHVYR